MSTDHQAQVAELLADYRRSREQLASVQRELASLTGVARSPDGLVTATVGPHGNLVELDIADAAYQRHRPDQLADLIVRTTATAAAKAAESAHRVLAPVLPADADPAALLAGSADLRPDEIAPQPAEAAPTGRARERAAAWEHDDESFEDQPTWLHEVERGR